MIFGTPGEAMVREGLLMLEAAVSLPDWAALKRATQRGKNHMLMGIRAGSRDCLVESNPARS